MKKSDAYKDDTWTRWDWTNNNILNVSKWYSNNTQWHINRYSTDQSASTPVALIAETYARKELELERKCLP